MAAKQPNELEPWAELTGKIVLVTGASSGIGRELSLDLAKAGCKIIAAARRIERLKALCDEINGQGFAGADGVRAVALQLDVSGSSPEIEAAVQRAWGAFGRIDALVNNAGITGLPRSSVDLPEEEWNAIHRTNLTGAWLVAKYFAKCLLGAKHKGSIINMGSIAGLSRGQLHGTLAYAASKAGMVSLTMMMAIELGGRNIRINGISAGLFKSESTEQLMEKSWLATFAARAVPLRDFGTVDPALTSIVRYLIHDSSAYVSGNTFVIDAGVTLTGIPIFSSL